MAQVEVPFVPLEVVRGKLGKMTERIIFRLQDRSTLPLNPPIYQPGAIPLFGSSQESLLEFAVTGLETYHASLVSSTMAPTMTTRVTDGGLPPIPIADIGLKDKLIPFYTETVLPRLCQPTDDPTTYGEAAYMDADVLELINERINLGCYVARAKVESIPEMWNLVEDSQGLMEALRDTRQEERVIGGVRLAAARYGLNEDLGESVFRWVIEQTIGVEVEYLQRIHER